MNETAVGDNMHVEMLTMWDNFKLIKWCAGDILFKHNVHYTIHINHTIFTTLVYTMLTKCS